MSSTVQELNAELKGGQRGNRFRLNFELPSGISGDLKRLQILAKGADLPGQNVGQIEIKHQGQTSRIAGDKVTDGTWTVTIRVPSDAMTLYKSFYDWAEKCAPTDGSVVNPTEYTVDMKAEQLGLGNTVSASFELKSVWVATLPPITLDDEASDALQEFAVTFSIDTLVPVSL